MLSLVLVYVITTIKKNEFGGARSTYGGQKMCIQGFCGGNLREIDNCEVLGVDGMIILKWILNELDGGSQT